MTWGSEPIEDLPLEVLEDRPEVWEENAIPYRAFGLLSPDRATGSGEGFIPWPSVRQYADEVDVDALDLLYLIRAMDREYLAYRRQMEEEKRARDKRSAERKGVPRRHR